MIITTSLAPWLFVRNGAKAVAFYQSAFGAVEVYHMESPDGAVVSRLSIDGAEFWMSDESPEYANFAPETLGGATTRIILTVADPEALVARAVAAGASLVHPVVDENDWHIGRVRDPYGHHWEIGYPLNTES